MIASLAFLLFATPVAADSTTTDTALTLLREAVARYAEPFDDGWDATTMRVAWTDLDDDGQEDALVYLDGAAWCGSGGCTLLVFAAVDSTDAEELGAYAPVAEISLINGPVTVLPERSAGWHDLVVEGDTGEWRRLAFDGETYPFSPSDGAPVSAPAGSGTVLFGDA